MESMEKILIRRALESGFSRAAFLDDLSLSCREDLRAFCTPDTCPSHGHSWVCPPGCGTLEECREKISRFTKGLLLQSVTELTPPTPPETYRELNIRHNLRFRKLIEEMAARFREILPLTTGGCIFCDSCSYPDPCRNPDRKMESLSAFGIDVAGLCQEAGLSYSFRKDMVYFTALLLVK